MSKFQAASTINANIRKNLSTLWDEESDPYQVFKVEHEVCLDLEIEVIRGENITKGSYLKDVLDTPDPYIVLKVPGSSNPSHRTTAIYNSITPIWNQTFHFYLDPQKTYVLNLTLMDENYTIDETLGFEKLSLSTLELGTPINQTFIFPCGSKIFIRLLLKTNKNPDLRFSLALCDEEKTFLRNRRDNVLLALQKLLGNKGPTSKYEVPVIAVLGSGGGFRAMASYSGVIKALHESRILNCVAYLAGLSGSSWLISTLYSQDNFPDITYNDIHAKLKEAVTTTWKKHLFNSYSYISEMIYKYRKGQPISLTDFFGHLLGDVLLKDTKHKKLSDQQEVISKATVPFPLYTCLHVQASVACKQFSEWVEFSPYEIGIAKYGTFMKASDFGNKFLCGKKIKAFPEFPIHYLQGVWGSAYSIVIKNLLIRDVTNNRIAEADKDERELNCMLKSVSEEVEKQCLEITNSLIDTSDSDSESDESDAKIDKKKNYAQDVQCSDEQCSHNSANSSDNSEAVDKSLIENNLSKMEKEVDKVETKFFSRLKKPLAYESLVKKKDNSSSLLQSMMSYLHLLNSRDGRAAEIFNPFRGLSLRESFPLSPFASIANSEESDDLFDFMEIGPDSRYKSLDPKAKKLFVVDSGLAFNSPYPLLLRPQRGVNVYLSFDFSQRSKDSHHPFKELLLAEKWANQNKVPFPPVELQVEEYKQKKEIEELYVFKHPTDTTCPVILHFPIVNNKFQFYKDVGVRRETIEELHFGDFSLFNDPSKPYSSSNFFFSELQYERLTKLAEFNTKLNINRIKDELCDAVERRKQINQNHFERVALKVQMIMKVKEKLRSKVKNRMSLKLNENEAERWQDLIQNLYGDTE